MGLLSSLLPTALLYPGDKIITLKEEVRPIRQPGGYYIDERIVHSLAGFGSRGLRKLGAKKTDKLSFRLSLQLQGLGHWHACGVMLCPCLCPSLVTSDSPVPNVTLSACLRTTGLYTHRVSGKDRKGVFSLPCGRS